jgi:hypothetical protein
MNQLAGADASEGIYARYAARPGSLRLTDLSPPAQPAISKSARDAINKLVGAVQSYGQALQALAGDSSVQNFNTNVTQVSSGLKSLDTSTLQPLHVELGLDANKVAGITQAVQLIGDTIVNALINRDVKAAAQAQDTALLQIVLALKDINNTVVAKALAPDTLADIRNYYLLELHFSRASRADFMTVLALSQNSESLVDPTAVNAALDKLEPANKKVADAGPSSALADIQQFWQSAVTAYQTYTGKK